MELIINPEKASKLVGGQLNKEQIRATLRLCNVPWGYAYKNATEYTYIISKAKFCEYFGIKEET